MTHKAIVEEARARGVRQVAALLPGREGCLSFYEGDDPQVPAKSRSSLILATVPGERVLQVDYPKLAFAMAAPLLLPTGPPKVSWGQRVSTGRYTAVGGEGFGFVWYPEAHRWLRFPHYGGVSIDDDVEIGSFVTIDRGSLDDTIIERGTKIDNHVHIGHGAWIGPHCVIVAMSVIGGSAILEEGVQVGMGALIRDHVQIGAGAKVSMGAVVSRDVPPGDHVTGNLAYAHKRFMAHQKELARA